jgi:hypothetical protein
MHTVLKQDSKKYKNSNGYVNLYKNQNWDLKKKIKVFYKDIYRFERLFGCFQICLTM